MRAIGHTTKTGCQCKVCILTHKVQAVQEKLSPDDRATIEQLMNEWACDSMEAGCAKARLKGTWPDSKTIAAAPPTTCLHLWQGEGEMPAKWNCQCGTLIYRSYEDYCWD